MIIDEARDEVTSVLGNNLKLLMQRNGYTQRALADKIGVSVGAINGYLNNEKAPGIEFFVALKNLFGISVDEMISPSFDVNESRLSEADKKEYSAAKKYFGSYYAYYMDTSSYKGRDYNDAEHSMRYGIIHIYENVKSQNKAQHRCIALLGMTNFKDTEIIRKQIDECVSFAEILELVKEDYKKYLYHGEFALGEDFAFLSMEHSTRDKALAIFHRVKSNKDKYIGGMGSINSVSKGRQPMPTNQFIGISREKIQLSVEDIQRGLLLNYPSFKITYEAEELLAIMKKYYIDNDGPSKDMSDDQKLITIKANMEKYIKESLKNNMYRYGKVSDRDDDDWYHLIKANTNEENDA